MFLSTLYYEEVGTGLLTAWAQSLSLLSHLQYQEQHAETRGRIQPGKHSAIYCLYMQADFCAEDLFFPHYSTIPSLMLLYS